MAMVRHTLATTGRLSPFPKQWELIDCPADIVVFGGGAGGGKSDGILMEPICRGLHEIPGFTAAIFRREGKEITDPNGLWDKACSIYPYVGGEVHVSDREFRFPSGAKIAFRHVENEQDKHKFAGSEICYLAFDELYRFTESQFRFLLSRNRSTCGVRPYVRATTNPDPGWCRKLIEPWVSDEWEGERPKPGEIWWQIRPKGQTQWVPEGTPHAKSITFIQALLADNPALYEDNPDYEATLRSLDEVDQSRLLEGDWNVRREGLVYREAFDPAFGVVVERCPAPQEPEVGGMDFGVRNAFVALSGHIDHDDVLWITSCYYANSLTIPQHSPNLPQGVSWWCDPSGTEQWMQLRTAGHNVRPCTHQPIKGASGEVHDPLSGGISMVRWRMRTGRLKIVRGACVDLIKELGLYTYDPAKPEEERPLKKHDHSPDALRYLIVGLDRRRAVPKVERQILEPEPADLEAEFGWR